MSGNRNRILLVGVDGIGLSDLKTYQLKNFQSVLRHGASGRINNASSLPITTAWTGLATGCSANKHGILSDSTIDESSDRTRAVGPADWNRPPIWDLLDGNGLLTHRFNMPARHPEQEQDHCLSISPLFFNQLKSNSLQTRRSVQPIDFFDAAKTLAITPAHVDRATLELFIPDIGNPQTAQFPEVGKMAGSIASNLSIQAIAGQIITELDWNLFMIRFSLADEINRILARAEHASSHFENAREAAFRTLNLCLGSFRRLAGNHTLVLCSMHGEGGGFVAFEGSNIKSGEKLLGPRPEDVAPTLLNLLGLSQSSQMNGRVLDELFRTHPATDLCPPSPNLSTYEVPTEEESAWLLEPFEINQAPWRIDVQANQRKAEAHLKLGQWFDALPHLLEQHVAAPFSLQHALPVCRVLFLSGLVAEAAELMIQTAELHPTAPISPLLKALAAYHTGHSAEAEKWMESYNGHQAINPDWKLFLAEIYLHLKQPETALSQLVELLDDSPDHRTAR